MGQIRAGGGMVPLVVLTALLVGSAAAQQPEPGSIEPQASSPGALGLPSFAQPDAPLGGRIGPSVPRVPPSLSQPSATGTGRRPDAVEITPPPILPAAELPAYGDLALPEGADDEIPEPPTGLTLDAAIAHLLAANLDLRARFDEIPQAQADILTAGLRANPILFADVQMVPYGSFSEERNGGPTQYDLNISIPLDLSNKRGARLAVAGRARQVVEAQYQDAARLMIDNLYTAYVDVLAARETIRFAQASVTGLEEMIEPLRRRLEEQLITEAEVNRARIQLDFARLGLADAEQTYRKEQHSLAMLLNIPPAQAEALELRGSVRDGASMTPPNVETLVRLALECRPDLMAYRLGVLRAHAEVRLAEANRWADIYWLIQPYTFQDLRPFDTGDPNVNSWATGVTIPLPFSDRNQGNIRRAQINVRQTRTELAALERMVTTEVIRADKDYQLTRVAVQRVESQLLPAARQVLETARLNFERGETDLLSYLDSRRNFNDVVRQYRDFLVRYRRSMLALNTAVGRRVLP